MASGTLTGQIQAAPSPKLTFDELRAVMRKIGAIAAIAVLTAVAVVSYFLVGQNVALAMPFAIVGALGGLVLVLIATFARKQDNPAIVLSYVLMAIALRAIPFGTAYAIWAGIGGVVCHALYLVNLAAPDAAL